MHISAFTHNLVRIYQFMYVCVAVGPKSPSKSNVRHAVLFPQLLNGSPQFTFPQCKRALSNARTCDSIFCVLRFFLNSLVWSFSISSISHHRFLSPPTHETLAFFSSSFFEHVCYSVHVCCRVHVYKAGCFIRKRPIKLSYHYINWSH